MVMWYDEIYKSEFSPTLDKIEYEYAVKFIWTRYSNKVNPFGAIWVLSMFATFIWVNGPNFHLWAYNSYNLDNIMTFNQDNKKDL